MNKLPIAVKLHKDYLKYDQPEVVYVIYDKNKKKCCVSLLWFNKNYNPMSIDSLFKWAERYSNILIYE